MKLINQFYNYEKVDAKVPENEEEVALCRSGQAIVFFEAEWSGSSRTRGIALAHKLNSLDLKNTAFFVIDIDQISGEIVKSVLGKRSHGNGEAVFLQSGKVMARHAGNESFEDFLVYLDNNMEKLP